jgi:hypothetical protein
MQIQFSTTENCSSPLRANGLSFEGTPPPPPDADPPENQGGGGTSGLNQPVEEDEETEGQ